MKHAIVSTALLLLFAGCASAPPTNPTHYWESATASTNKYRVEEQGCQERAAGSAATFPQFDPASESYEAYRACMIERGYVLRQY